MRRLSGAALSLLLLAAPVLAQETPAQVTVTETTAMPLDENTKCLALAVYWEGKNESREGQLAVAHTVLNRTRNPKFPDTICGVVSQKAERGKGCQFSWWCDGKRDEPKEDGNWKDAVDNARAALTDAKDPTDGALYFHSAKIKPPVWVKQHRNLGRIGDHIFYR